VETVVMGNVVQAGTKMNPARQAAVHAGLPVTTPALTVNRVCGSGAQAIVSAAQEIALGNIDAAVAGGMENMDLAPYLVPRARWGYRMGDGPSFTTAYCATAWTMRFQTRIRAGTPKTWSKNIR
jgi:acetyl-CoA C-acetyltransferase